MRSRHVCLILTAALLTGGCGKERVREVLQPPLAPDDPLRIVESHIFADHLNALREPGSRELTVPWTVPEPDPLSSITPHHIEVSPDIASIRRGIEGRMQAAVRKYGQNVRQRELRSAALSADIAVQQFESEHGEDLAEARRWRSEAMSEAATLSTTQRSKLLFDIAVLRAKVSSEVLPASEEDRAALREMEADLEDLEAQREARETAIRAEYEERVRGLESAWQERIADTQAAERQQALVRVEEQIARQSQSAREAADLFISRVRRSTPGGDFSVRETHTRAVPGGSASVGAERSIRAAGARAWTRMLADARLASELAAKTAGGGSPQAVGKRAGGFLGGD